MNRNSKRRLLNLCMALACGCLPGLSRAAAVDPTSLDGKVLFGYQGWFGCPGSWGGNWSHWSNGTPSGTSMKVDMYPDLSEFPKSDLCQAGNLTIGGAPAYLFSARNPNVVDRHFKWMQDYGLDGVLIQRFVTDIPGLKRAGDVTLKNILASSLKYGRVVAIEYDVTGANFGTWSQDIQADWKYLVDTYKIAALPNYQHHKGLPLVSVWGVGLNETRNPPTNPAEALALVNWFHTGAPIGYRASIMGGVPAAFRTLNQDARTDPAWLNVYKAMDAVQPWNVGRYTTLNEAKGRFKNTVAADQKWLADAGVTYMPVIFPGFSWANASGSGKQNQIPRLGGNFIWQQAMATKSAGVGAVKIAMFDEVNESTSMFKVVSKRKEAPDQSYWLAQDADGLDLPSDWYLRLAGEITKITHGLQAPTDAIPIKPGDAYVNAVNPGPAGSAIRSGLEWRRMPEGIRFSIRATSIDGTVYGVEKTLMISDPRGAIVRTLAIKQGVAYWDLRAQGGESVPKGIYMATAGGLAKIVFVP